MFEPDMAPTAPVLDLTPQDLDGILDDLRAYHAIFSPLFQHGLLLDIPRTSIEPMALRPHDADRSAVRPNLRRSSPFIAPVVPARCRPQRHAGRPAVRRCGARILSDPIHQR